MLNAALVALSGGVLFALFTAVSNDSMDMCEIPEGFRLCAWLTETLDGLRFALPTATAVWLAGRTDVLPLILIAFANPVWQSIGRSLRATLPDIPGVGSSEMGAFVFGAFYALTLAIAVV